MEDRSFLDRDMMFNRLYGIPSREYESGHAFSTKIQEELMKEGQEVPPRLLKMKDFDSIQSLYNHPFVNQEDIFYERKSYKESLLFKSLKTQKDRMRKKILTSKSMSFKVDHHGNSNYNWQQLWPTQKSFRDTLVPFDVRQVSRFLDKYPF